MLNSSNNDVLVIGIVAGEISGDSLGADFMQQMNALMSNVRWVGVGGVKMEAQGLEPLFDMSRLSVMGLFEVVKHLPDLFDARDALLNMFAVVDINCFIGIDAPDFNLQVAKKLKPHGVFCVQYVSPSIWAWRENRIHTIKKATDLVLCLFPFELEVYERHEHPAVCVGHPLLQSIDARMGQIDKGKLREAMYGQQIDLQRYFDDLEHPLRYIISLLPGSRASEIDSILPIMLSSIGELLKQDNKLCFVLPVATEALLALIESHIDKQPEAVRDAIAIVCDTDNTYLSQQIIAMSDLVLLASGTATLEAMLLTRPMVVIYKLHELTYQLAKKLFKAKYVALPNILAGEEIVPELIQHEANGENIARMVWKTLKDRAYQQQIEDLQQTSKNLRLQSNQSPIHAFLDHLTMH